MGPCTSRTFRQMPAATANAHGERDRHPGCSACGTAMRTVHFGAVNRGIGSRRALGVGLVIAGGVALIAAAVGLITADEPERVDNEERATATTTTGAAVATTTSVAAVSGSQAEAFVRQLTAAISEGNTDFLTANIDPLVIGVYGAQSCAAVVADAADEARVTVVAIDGPADYTWAADGLSFRVPRVWTVHVDDANHEPPRRVDWHVGTAAGRPTWFTDCGTPLPAPRRQVPDYAREGEP